MALHSHRQFEATLVRRLSLYEQLRFELLNFRASNGDVQQFPQPSYSGVHFQGARFFAGFGFNFRERTGILLGFKAEAEVSSSGSTVTLFYGPVFSIEYNLSRAINEKHKRTTAFKDF